MRRTPHHYIPPCAPRPAVRRRAVRSGAPGSPLGVRPGPPQVPDLQQDHVGRGDPPLLRQKHVRLLRAEGPERVRGDVVPAVPDAWGWPGQPTAQSVSGGAPLVFFSVWGREVVAARGKTCAVPLCC